MLVQWCRMPSRICQSGINNVELVGCFLNLTAVCLLVLDSRTIPLNPQIAGNELPGTQTYVDRLMFIGPCIILIVE